jgi:hypothetical protein
LTGYWKISWDSAFYIVLAESLGEGGGYSYMGYPHFKYPPGLSLILAPIEYLFGHQYLLMRLFIMICAVVSIGLTWQLIKSHSNAAIAIVVSGLTAASYGMIELIPYVISDVPYMLASLGALICADRYRRDPSGRSLLWAVVLILIACSIRLVGISLVIALVISIFLDGPHQSFSRRARDASVVVLIFGLVAGFWFGRAAVLTDRLPSELRESQSYQQEFMLEAPEDADSGTLDLQALRIRLVRNLPHYEKLLTNLISARLVESQLLVHLLSFLWLSGFVIALMRQRSVMEYYTLAYFGIYLLWPSWQGERFLIPVLPMIFYYALQPLLALLRWEYSGRSVQGPGLAAISLALIMLNAPLLIQAISAERREPYYRGSDADYFESMSWLRAHTSEDSVVITDKAPVSFLMSGRKSLTPTLSRFQSEVLESIILNGGTHIVIRESGYARQFVNPVVESRPEIFRELHRVGTATIYEIHAN